jgi:hypothetical protein
MKRIPLYAYVAANNPYGGADVLRKFRVQHEASKSGIARGLRYAMVTFGEDAFREIAKVHPDKELILDSHEEVEQEVLTIPEVKSGCSGCGGNCDCKSNTNGVEHSHNAPNQDLLDDIKELKTKEKLRSEKEAMQNIATEVKKTLGNTKSFVETNLPYIALGGVALFFMYKYVNK